ncbi:MAG TPA: C-terminal helicase domain-containing protein, partial [Nannocystis sp.]
MSEYCEVSARKLREASGAFGGRGVRQLSLDAAAAGEAGEVAEDKRGADMADTRRRRGYASVTGPSNRPEALQRPAEVHVGLVVDDSSVGGDLSRDRAEDGPEHEHEDEDDEDSGERQEGHPGGLSSGFLITLLARLAESSALALTTCIDRLLDRAENGELPASDLTAVTQALRHLQSLARARSQDTKLAALFQLIDRTDSREKILVFSEFVATVEYLQKRLRERYNDRRVASITGRMRPEERRQILRRFAPEAQQVHRPPAAQELDILVASDAISEGENLQDARVVVNFDLPWTPLRLIQRIGRVDRFTRSPRTIQVYHLFPREGEYERIVRLWERLSNRDTENTAISGYPNVAEHERSPEHLAATEPSQWLHTLAEPDLDLADLRAKSSDVFPHARLLDVLWAAAEYHEAARSLPDGVQAAAYGTHPGLYVLLRLQDKRMA